MTVAATKAQEASRDPRIQNSQAWIHLLEFEYNATLNKLIVSSSSDRLFFKFKDDSVLMVEITQILNANRSQRWVTEIK